MNIKKFKYNKIKEYKLRALQNIEQREAGAGRVSIKGAIKGDMSYNKIKELGVKIRKQYYFTLKRLYKGQELTEGQKKAVEEMKKSKKWKEIVEWAEEEGNKNKMEYIRAEGTIIFSGGYIATDKKGKKTEVYYEYVLNCVAYAKIGNETGEDAEIRAEMTTTHAFRHAILDFFDNNDFSKGIIREVRADVKNDWTYEEVKEFGENEIWIIQDSFILSKKNGKLYDYTKEITSLFTSYMLEDGWNVR